MTDITFREPLVDDADSIWNLVKNNKPLDENSKYLYILLCHEFSNTCVLAESTSKIVGFASTFVSPKNPDTLFVWQVAVDKNYRNKGIAQDLVSQSLRRVGPSIHYVHATVTPSNTASLKFLQNFAKELNAPLSTCSLFTKSVLGKDHEQEDLVRIGPIPKQVKEVIA